MLHRCEGVRTHQTIREDLKLFLGIEILMFVDNYGGLGEMRTITKGISISPNKSSHRYLGASLMYRIVSTASYSSKGERTYLRARLILSKSRFSARCSIGKRNCSNISAMKPRYIWS